MTKSSCVTEVYSRIVGFFRPVSQWNPGKAEEFKSRDKYDKSTNPDKYKKESQRLCGYEKLTEDEDRGIK
jgi:hypothetical protein